jgi:hypothetical protein
VTFTPKGLGYSGPWGSLRHVGNALFLMKAYAAGNPKSLKGADKVRVACAACVACVACSLTLCTDAHACPTRPHTQRTTQHNTTRTTRTHHTHTHTHHTHKPHTHTHTHTHTTTTTTKQRAIDCTVKSQLGYILGDTGRSFVVGYGTNPPTQPHHRSSSCPSPLSAPCEWAAFNNPGPNPQTLYGALVGGPGASDDYDDKRNDYIKNEVATDYNAGFTGAGRVCVCMCVRVVVLGAAACGKRTRVLQAHARASCCLTRRGACSTPCVCCRRPGCRLPGPQVLTAPACTCAAAALHGRKPRSNGLCCAALARCEPCSGISLLLP